jgi:hypothetical protein
MLKTTRFDFVIGGGPSCRHGAFERKPAPDLIRVETGSREENASKRKCRHGNASAIAEERQRSLPRGVIA